MCLKYIADILAEVATWCNHDPTPDPIITIKYGALYNWYAATDAREFCSAGWHIPTSTELYNLMRYIDPDGLPNNNDAGGYLKETGIVYWSNPNVGATNTYGLNIRGAGNRHYTTGAYGGMGGNTRIWTSDEKSTTNANVGQFENSSAIFYMAYGIYNSNFNKKYGHSIRPFADTTTLSDGEEGTYTSNDGQIYRTICINGVEIVADNIAETKYRNGTTIPIVTDNASWAALVTGGMCYYNNDISNM